ncbi:hypothetical protein AGRA3207_007015 [Actinomadura graeca]|uniref:ATP-binding protein n=1 Tax=Actinomadura graeca TaxID=2750812 RepID=A0ABX8R4M3_9ACTN|nr:hypothetical protein [Actinomadura graeca]QXJ25511.1 hypothetical protein AGRA3207_007015 [Actinomadura graeca]
MGRGQRIDRTNWPGDGPHRRLLELLDRVHRDNGQKSRRDIGAQMHIESASYINDWLRGLRLPVDGRQLEHLVRAMDGGDGDVRAAVRLYEEARSARAEPSPHPWTAQAEGHAAWTLVDERRDASPFRGAAAALAERLGVLCSEAEADLDDDPWLDTGLAGRFTKWTDWLLRTTFAGSLSDLSPAEAALLALVPPLHHAHLARTLAGLREVGPLDLGTGLGDGPRREYESFLGGQREMVDRARARTLPDRDTAATEIGWWLFRRWATRFPPSYRLGAVRDLLDDAGVPDPRMRDGILDAKTVQRFLATLRLDLSELGDTGRKNAPQFEAVLFAGEPHEQRVRELLIGQVLTVSHALTLDLARLPDVVARHLGIPHPVTLPELRATVLDRANWVRRLDCLVLSAECRHPAELEGLRQYAVQVDALLHTVRQGRGDHPTLNVLADLPARASAEGVEAATDDDGRALFQRVSRFRLDERRVQELLMGEQLYQDRGLAIRELYQNALDACRYRRARLAYRGQGDWQDDWRGRILLTQGVDANGRAYLECLDNGIGMTETVLTDVFSQAGTRFTHTAEFLVESAEWRSSDPPIPFHANSRFGIGVLSYFMIADEIEVVTRPLDRGNRPHPTLKVSIFGPGHLFRIEHLPADRPAGTRVRLYLREGEDAPSCVDELRRLLGIAEFETRARREDQDEHWEPGVLKPRVRPSWQEDGLDAHGRLVHWRDADGGQVVWCEKGGGLLVDGIYARPALRRGVLAGIGDGDLRGAVVNLTGASAPARLSVDRRTVLSDASGTVERLLAAAAGELMTSGTELLDVGWVSAVGAANPRLADLVTEKAAEAGRPFADGDGKIDVASTGCFLQDTHLLGVKEEGIGGAAVAPDLATWDFGVHIDDHLLLWRLIARGAQEELAALGAVETGAVRPALPSDVLLLAFNNEFINSPQGLSITEWGWAFDDVTTYPGHMSWIAMLTGTSPREAAQRALDLGLDVDPARFSADPEVDGRDLALLSTQRTGRPMWWRSTDVVPLFHLAALSLQYGIPVPELKTRLRSYGHLLPAEDVPSRKVSPQDLRLLSWSVDPELPIESREFPLPASHAVQCAWELGLPTADVCARLSEFGFRVDGSALPARPSAEDRTLFNWQLAFEEKEIDPALPLAPGHLVRAALDLRVPVTEVAARLAAYGVPVPDGLPERVEEPDLQVLRRYGALLGSCWPVGARIRLPELLFTSGKARLAPEAVAARLTEYGMDVPSGDLPAAIDDPTLRLMTDNYGRSMRLLDVDAPVPRRHLVQASVELGIGPREAAGRLASLGFTLPEGDIPEVADPADLVLLRYVRHKSAFWLESYFPVPLLHLLRVSRKLGIGVQEAAARLRWLGMKVPDVEERVAEGLRRVPRLP